MSDLEIIIAESKAGDAQSEARFLSSSNMVCDNKTDQLVEIDEQPNKEVTCCCIEFVEEGTVNDESCSYLYYTVCFGTWLMFGGVYGFGTYCMILAIIGIYINTPTKPEEILHETIDDRICFSATNVEETENYPIGVSSVPGPSTALD